MLGDVLAMIVIYYSKHINPSFGSSEQLNNSILLKSEIWQLCSFAISVRW